jgi:transposase InsO family protein
MDFVAAPLLGGRWFRVLTVVDQFTRECLLLLADTSLTGQKVALALSQVMAARGAGIDYGRTEFASRPWTCGHTAYDPASSGRASRWRTVTSSLLTDGRAMSA